MISDGVLNALEGASVVPSKWANDKVGASGIELGAHDLWWPGGPQTLWMGASDLK